VFKAASIAVHLELPSGSHQWNVSFIRATHNWDMNVFVLFFILLYSLRLRREVKTSFLEPPPKEGCLTLDLSTTSLSLMMTLPSLGK
jgi:hypothetical protein